MDEQFIVVQSVYRPGCLLWHRVYSPLVADKLGEVVRYWLARQAPSVFKAFLLAISIHGMVYHARCSSYVCSREEYHPFSKISGVAALLFHSLDIDLHHIHHDGDYRVVSCARRQFLEPSQGNETYSDNLLLNNSLRCCMGPIHGRKYRHVFLREMFHT